MKRLSSAAVAGSLASILLLPLVVNSMPHAGQGEPRGRYKGPMSAPKERVIVIGNGTPESCTTQAIEKALNSAKKLITLNCGPRLALSRTLIVKHSPRRQVVILDGKGTVLVAPDKQRHFEFDTAFDARFQFVIQNTMITGGYAQRTKKYPQLPGDKAHCAHGYKDGKGGAILGKGGKLTLINTVFVDNHAAYEGPDTGGGAIYYRRGKLEVINSFFYANKGANGGAIGILQGTIYTDGITLVGNEATGAGGNYANAGGCPKFNHRDQGGYGGNGAAIAVDGKESPENTFWGLVCISNRAGANGGCIFRTSNRTKTKLSFYGPVIMENKAGDVGGGIRAQEIDLYIGKDDNGQLPILYKNESREGLGGGLSVGQNKFIKSDILVEDLLCVENVAPRGGCYNGAVRGTMNRVMFVNNRFSLDAKLKGGAALFGRGLLLNRISIQNHKQRPCINTRAPKIDPSVPSFTQKNSAQWPAGNLCVQGMKVAKLNLERAKINTPQWDFQIKNVKDDMFTAFKRATDAQVIEVPQEPPPAQLTALEKAKILFCSQEARDAVITLMGYREKGIQKYMTVDNCGR